MTAIAHTRNHQTTPFGRHGRLKIQGKDLIDSNGEICQLKGLSSHNIFCYPEYLNESTITELTDRFGLEIFRFAMYSGFADEKYGYADGDDEVRSRAEAMLMDMVNITAKLGIYLIVDWHILLDYDPNMHTDMAISFFEKICPLLKDYDHILYEICNEPNKDCTWSEVCHYANQVIPVIQAIDDTKVIIVGTPVWSQRVDEPAANPLPYPNLTYTLHFYSDTHRDELRRLAADAIENSNLPIFVSEFGICDATGSGPVNMEQTNLWIELMDKYHLSYVLWNLSNKDETSAILKPDCKKLTGFTENDFTESGKFLSTMIKTNQN